MEKDSAQLEKLEETITELFRDEKRIIEIRVMLGKLMNEFYFPEYNSNYAISKLGYNSTLRNNHLYMISFYGVDVANSNYDSLCKKHEYFAKLNNDIGKDAVLVIFGLIVAEMMHDRIIKSEAIRYADIHLKDYIERYGSKTRAFDKLYNQYIINNKVSVNKFLNYIFSIMASQQESERKLR